MLETQNDNGKMEKQESEWYWCDTDEFLAIIAWIWTMSFNCLIKYDHIQGNDNEGTTSEPITEILLIKLNTCPK